MSVVSGWPLRLWGFGPLMLIGTCDAQRQAGCLALLLSFSQCASWLINSRFLKTLLLFARRAVRLNICDRLSTLSLSEHLINLTLAFLGGLSESLAAPSTDRSALLRPITRTII